MLTEKQEKAYRAKKNRKKLIDKIFSDFKSDGNAELTNRLIVNDPDFDYPEWIERGTIDGVPIAIYYRTTPEDQKKAEELEDWGSIDWEDRITRVVNSAVECDREGISDEAIQAVKEKYQFEKI